MTTEKNTTPPALEALALEGVRLESEATQADQPGPGDSQEPTKPTNAQIIAGAIAAGRTVFCVVTKLESPKRHLDDATAQALGDAWGPVCEKYGLDLGETLGGYMVELGALILTAQVAYTLREAVLHELAQQEAKPAQTDPNTVENGEA